MRQRMKEIAETRVRYGFSRIQILLRREGWKDNHKRTYRIYREEGLNLRSKRPRRSKAAAHRLDRPQLTGPYECWSLDFVHDQLYDGRKFRALTLVDNFSRECMEIEVWQNLTGIDVVGVMNRIKDLRRVVPQRIQVDNGNEFISKALDLWAYENEVTLDFSRPGNQRIIRSSNLLTEVFAMSVWANWFLSLEDAKEKIEAYKRDHNSFRPHSAQGGRKPSRLLAEHLNRPNSSALDW